MVGLRLGCIALALCGVPALAAAAERQGRPAPQSKTMPLAPLKLLPPRPAPGRGAVKPAAGREGGWTGGELPLPLAVRTPEDLAFKAAAERQYLVFNLLAEGKLAWDRGDASLAAERWEALLRVPDLAPEVDDEVRPWALQARKRAGGPPAELPPPPAAAQRASPSSTPSAPPSGAGAERSDPPPERRALRRSTPALATVSGTVQGGGAQGPGGAVIWLKRTDGTTPHPKPGRARTVLQREKRFLPRVLAVAVGTTVHFRNDDPIFHNVFSLSKPNAFDLGLYEGGAARDRVFTAPGPVDLLCNIHSAMGGSVYVVDSPWFTQADGSGRFAIRGVPPGQYALEVWHEASSRTVRRTIEVAEDGPPGLTLALDGDRATPAFVPDKYGKPRQPQLGY